MPSRLAGLRDVRPTARSRRARRGAPRCRTTATTGENHAQPGESAVSSGRSSRPDRLCRRKKKWV